MDRRALWAADTAAADAAVLLWLMPPPLLPLLPLLLPLLQPLLLLPLPLLPMLLPPLPRLPPPLTAVRLQKSICAQCARGGAGAQAAEDVTR